MSQQKNDFAAAKLNNNKTHLKLRKLYEKINNVERHYT